MLGAVRERVTRQANAPAKESPAPSSADTRPPARPPSALLQEVLPSLLHIASPPLRPVSRHLYSPEEQAAVGTLVGTLLSYGLRFAQEGEGKEEDESDPASEWPGRLVGFLGAAPA